MTTSGPRRHELVDLQTVRDFAGGEVVELPLCRRTSSRIHRADHDVGAASPPPVRLVEHRVGLPDAGAAPR